MHQRGHLRRPQSLSRPGDGGALRSGFGVGALALALSACGSSESQDAPLGPVHRYPVPGCEGFDPAPCDVRLTECQSRLFGLAACLRGSEAGDLPLIKLVSEDDYRADLTSQYAAQTPSPYLAEWDSAYAMLGLEQPGELDPAARIDEQVAFTYGFYGWHSKAILIIDHGNDTDLETSSAVLLHEFDHALQDREVDLASFHDRTSHSYDSALAANAVAEGEAQFQELRYLTSMLGFDPHDFDYTELFRKVIGWAEGALLAQPSVLTSARHYFPYYFGARLVHLGWPETGHSGVLDLFAAPPTTTWRVMASADSIVDERVPLELPLPPDNDRWALLGSDHLGAIGAFELVGRHLPLASAERAALDWRGDQLGVYSVPALDVNADAATVVVWNAEFASAATAGDVADALARQTGSDQVRSAGTKVTVARSDDGSSVEWVFDALQ